MPGTVTFKPLQADLTKEKTFLGTLDPYCQIILGHKKVKTQVCKKGGSSPIWNDSLTLKKEDESVCTLELKDKETLIPDGTIGRVQIDLDEVVVNKKLSRWYDVMNKDEIMGQILVESYFTPENLETTAEASK